MLYVAALLAVVMVAFFAWGLRLPKTRYVTRDILIDAPVEEVWNVVTDFLGQVKWRTDLNSVEIGHTANGQDEWIERPRRGAPVRLRILRQREPQLLEVERLQNGTSSGQWTGSLEKAASATHLRVAETTTTPGLLARMRAHLLASRGADIETYQRDLKRYIENRNTAARAK